MRVIGGTARGTRLTAPPSRIVRPTPDRMRESIFNILAERVVGARVLDLFAGTGSPGIEALSRGAAACTFVEKERICLAALRVNLERTHLADRATVITRDAFRCLAALAKTGAAFDLIFVDPPYRMTDSVTPGDDVYELLCRLAEAGLFGDGCTLSLEHSHRSAVADSIGPLARFDTRRFGDAAVSLYATPAEA